MLNYLMFFHAFHVIVHEIVVDVAVRIVVAVAFVERFANS